VLKKIDIKVKGRTELLMHNARLVNPMDPATKEVAEAYAEWKRLKTDDAFERLCNAEFRGSMYHLESDGVVIGPYWPSDNLSACLKAAGAKIKKGRASLKNTVAAAVLPDGDGFNPLTYQAFGGSKAPRDLETLWVNGNYHDTRPSRVGSSKVMRTRPLFKKWGFEAPFLLDTEILDPEDLDRVLLIAGQVIGIGDWRPEKGGRRGRFDATVTDKGEWLGEVAA
jgi:hypothetical protein